MFSAFPSRIKAKPITILIVPFLISLIFIIMSLIATADAADLDTTFDTDGKVTTGFAGGGDGDEGFRVAIQSDGKIVVAGTKSEDSGNADFAVARYNTDGSLDITFDTDGKVTTSFSVGDDSSEGMAIQSDGKIVVTGIMDEDGVTSVFAIARYNTDGSLDTTFDTDGKVTTSFSGGNDEGESVAIQSDGKIVFVGMSDEGSGNGEFAIARYNSNGSLDDTFDTDGKVTTSFSDGDDEGIGVAIQSDGKIVVAGISDEGSGSSEFAIARYNSDGSLDTTFDTDGKVTTSFSDGDDKGGLGVIIQSDDKIVVVGFMGEDSGNADFAIARYNSNGSLDTTFDTDGKVTTSFSAGNDWGIIVTIQSDGKIVVAGTSDAGSGSSEFAIARYNSDGSLDTTFDTDGKVTTSFSAGDDEAIGVAIQSDDKIVVAGISDKNNSSVFAVARYVASPPAPSDLSATAVSTSQINLSWTDNSGGETGFKIERKTGSGGTYSQVATVAANVIIYNNTGLSTSTTYYYRVRSYNSAGNSSYSSEASATPSVDSSGGQGCFIATAAYGSAMRPHVKILRKFRDGFLLNNSVGKAFVQFYYTYSPPIADFIAKHASLRTITRLSLLPIVGLSWAALKIGPVYSLALMLLLFSGLIGFIGFRRKFVK